MESLKSPEREPELEWKVILKILKKVARSGEFSEFIKSEKRNSEGTMSTCNVRNGFKKGWKIRKFLENQNTLIDAPKAQK